MLNEGLRGSGEMRICMVNTFYPPYVGGAETYVSSLAKELVRRGHLVTVYCADTPSGPGEAFQEGVRVKRMRTPFMFYGTPIAVFPGDFLRGDYDVIHCNFPNPYFTAVSAWVSRMRGTPAVLTWHNDLPPVTWAARVLVGLHDRLADGYLGVYERVIATTEAYARSSRVLRRHAGRVRVIPNGVDTGRFHPGVDGGWVRVRYGLEGCTVALFVGALTRWHGYKGVDVLLRAFQLASRRREELRLLVVGGGSLLEAYRRQADELGLSGRVVFTGFVESDVLPLYYGACDFLVLPSRDRSEGFGLVLLEAMSSGRPVIGSRVGGLVDVVQAGGTGLLVEPNEPEVLADAVLALCDDETRARMAAAARPFAELYDWASIAARVESLYREIA